MNGLNWDGLRYFIAAAEEGSLTAAARRLGSNQPTVGRHIDALESELGIRLFQRSVKGLTLTEEGAALLEQCRVIQSQVIKIERLVGGEHAISGSVRLALPEGLCLEVVAPQLADFYRDHPDVRLLLDVSSNTANLTHGEADIAIRLFHPTESNLVARQLGVMRMGLYATPDYLARYGVPASADELPSHRVITYGDRLGALPENRWLLGQMAPAAPVLSSDSTAARLRATLGGSGISIQPQLFAQTNPQLQPLLPSIELPGHEIWLVYHQDLRQIPRVRAVAGFLTSILGDSR